MLLKNCLSSNVNLTFDIFTGLGHQTIKIINFDEQYKTGGGINFAKYSNAGIRQTMEQAQCNECANDPAKRRQALIQAETIGIAKDAVAAPIYQSSTSTY